MSNELDFIKELLSKYIVYDATIQPILRVPKEYTPFDKPVEAFHFSSYAPPEPSMGKDIVIFHLSVAKKFKIVQRALYHLEDREPERYMVDNALQEILANRETINHIIQAIHNPYLFHLIINISKKITYLTMEIGIEVLIYDRVS